MPTKKTRAAKEAFLADLASSQIRYNPDNQVPEIHSMEELNSNLPAMCEVIHKTLGSTNLEAMYQRCLAMDLEKAGLIVLSEVEIPVKYRGKKVGTRRGDLLVETPDGERAVLELKALVNPMPEKKKLQLTFYMFYFGAGIKHGFLINFPHDTGFPDVDPEMSRNYKIKETALCGGPLLRDATRSKGRTNANAAVQIHQLKLEPVAAADSQANTAIKPNASAAPAAPVIAPWKFGLTKKGTQCQHCKNKDRLCKRHAPKEA